MTTHSLPALPATNAELADATFPFPVDRDSHDWQNIHPACLLDHSQGGGLLTAAIVRLAIALGMPPQEFEYQEFVRTPRTKPAVTNTLANRHETPGRYETRTILDHTMLEVLGLEAEWWDGQWLTEFAIFNQVDECLDDMAQRAIDWLNGCGRTDTPDFTGTRCAPEYRDTHHYEIEDNSLYLTPNETEEWD